MDGAKAPGFGDRIRDCISKYYPLCDHKTAGAFALGPILHFKVDRTLVMGATTWQIISKVLLRKALPSLIASSTLTIVNLIGYSAIAGLVGGGGLGQVAIQYGYQRFNSTIMIATVVLLILLVQIVQWIGNRLAHKILRAYE